MQYIITKSQADALGFDLQSAVSVFEEELAAHALTVDRPAPAAHPLVEAIVRGYGGAFRIVDDEEPEQKPLTRVPKADIWRRLTDEEADAVDAALQAAPLRLRRIFEAAQYLDARDADYPALQAGIVAVLGEERAAEVLAPTY